MLLTLHYDGQTLGEVECGPPDERGTMHGKLRPNASYHMVRHQLRRPFLGLAQLAGASGEEIRAHLLGAQAQFAASGLTLLDATGETVAASFIQIVDGYPPDAEPEALEFLGIPIGITLAPAT